MKMKTIIGLTLLAALITVTGCAALQSAPPTKTEAKFYDITTNTVVKEVIVLHTNVVETTQVVPVVKLVDELHTNTIVVNEVRTNREIVTAYETNKVPVEEYQYAVKETTKAGVGVASMVANVAMPGTGSILSAVAIGILGIWGRLRSKQATTAQAVAANSTQVIETARSILLALPNGAALAAQYDAWMIQHQRDAGIANQVAAIVDKTVDPDQADMVATKLLALVTAPLTPPPAPAARGTSNLG